MAIPCPTTIAEIVWYFLVIIVGVVFCELRWAIHKIIAKFEELPDKYETKKEMEDWKKGRDGPGGLWESFNKHSHVGIEGKGEVIKK